MTEKRIIKTFKIAIVFFLIVYLSSSLIRGLINNRKVIARYEHVVEELSREKTVNKELKQKIALTEEPEYMELLARERLGLVKNDEMVYKIVYKQ